MRTRTRIHDDISAGVDVSISINGYRVDIEDLAVNVQRLINAASEFLPDHWLDDDERQSYLRKAVGHLTDMRSFH
jgi:hypothetical protein